MSRCTCAQCGRVFTSLFGFDKHQQRRFNTSAPIICRDPAEYGMVQNPRGQWKFPGDADSRQYHENLSAERVRSGTPATPCAENVSDSRTEAAP